MIRSGVCDADGQQGLWVSLPARQHLCTDRRLRKKTLRGRAVQSIHGACSGRREKNTRKLNLEGTDSWAPEEVWFRVRQPMFAVKAWQKHPKMDRGTVVATVV